MKLNLLCIICLGFAIGVHGQTVNAFKEIPFQGILKNSEGNIVTNSSQTVQFKLYNAPVGGSVVWNGEIQRLSVNNGLVSTVLGSKSRLNGVDFGQVLYLELTIDANGDGQITLADPPLLPRQSLLPAFFAFESGNSRKLGDHDWSVLFGSNDPVNGTLLDSKIADGSIQATKLAERTITGLQIRDGTIGERQLADNAVSEQKIAPGSVTSTRIASNAVGWSQRAGRVVEIGAASSAVGSVAVSSTVHGWKSDSSTEPRVVQNLEVVLDTSGGPITLELVGSDEEIESGRFSAISFATSPNARFQLYIELLRDDVIVSRYLRGEPFDPQALKDCYIPSSGIRWMDFPPSGSHRYKIRMYLVGAVGLAVWNTRLVAYEIR